MWLAVDSGKAPEANARIVMPHIGVNGGGQRTWERSRQQGGKNDFQAFEEFFFLTLLGQEEGSS